ncbi:hypothetical protein BT96DRAFT_1006196 [Gymnopus androsaceus JB14]|uniref:Enhancer of polycomb-like N-terminal domain-containing protein n=1 Tax=Gymnopus androsaceus JB14 TaxID=1447944 RepID=A0A6A4GLI7_9AGAR|nr:hypothetical protein BT96DRAFT_1006196 [Gymnopus androsaceus JB14]
MLLLLTSTTSTTSIWIAAGSHGISEDYDGGHPRLLARLTGAIAKVLFIVQILLPVSSLEKITFPHLADVADNYESLYPTAHWKDPVSYVQSTAVINEYTSAALADRCTYYMVERDKEWFDHNNEEARGEGTSAQGSISASTSRTTTQEKTELLHHILESGQDHFPEFSEYQQVFSVPLSPATFASYSPPSWLPRTRFCKTVASGMGSEDEDELLVDRERKHPSRVRIPVKTDAVAQPSTATHDILRPRDRLVLYQSKLDALPFCSRILRDYSSTSVHLMLETVLPRFSLALALPQQRKVSPYHSSSNYLPPYLRKPLEVDLPESLLLRRSPLLLLSKLVEMKVKNPTLGDKTDDELLIDRERKNPSRVRIPAKNGLNCFHCNGKAPTL